MRIVNLFWTRHGTDDILVRNAEGVLQKLVQHLDPDGCLVQQCEHITLRRCGKGSERHKADTTKPGLAQGGNFVKKQVEGGSIFS